MSSGVEWNFKVNLNATENNLKLNLMYTTII